MWGKVQSDNISFEEFQAKYPNDTLIIPDEMGFDGGMIYQIGLRVIEDRIRDLITYICNKVKDNAIGKGKTTFDYEDGFKVEIPLSQFNNSEKIMTDVDKAHDLFLRNKEKYTRESC